MTDEVSILGQWINQNGSRLKLEGSDGSRFHGIFQSRKGRAAQGIDYQVSGVQNGEILAFTVDFNGPQENLRSISNFSGRLFRTAEGVEAIATLWVLTRQFEDEARTKPTHVWNSFLINSDTFTRVAEDE